VTLGYDAQPPPHLRAGSSHPHQDHSAVTGVLLPDDETIRLELAYLPARCRRIHLCETGQLADLEPVRLLNAPEQLKPRLGNHHAGSGGAPAVHLTTGIETKQLLKRPFDAIQTRRTKAVRLGTRHNSEYRYLYESVN
jgi:hypothetical protein